jgi:Amt family ammonium transporter
LAFWCCGYAFAYGGDDEGGPMTFIGNTGFFLRNDDIQFENWFFQFAFACALSSIVWTSVPTRDLPTIWTVDPPEQKRLNN